MRTLSADAGGTFSDPVLIDGEAGAMHLDKAPLTPGRTGVRPVTAIGDCLAQDLVPAAVGIPMKGNHIARCRTLLALDTLGGRLESRATSMLAYGSPLRGSQLNRPATGWRPVALAIRSQ